MTNRGLLLTLAAIGILGLVGLIEHWREEKKSRIPTVQHKKQAWK
jgi:hypothetical protein